MKCYSYPSLPVAPLQGLIHFLPRHWTMKISMMFDLYCLAWQLVLALWYLWNSPFLSLSQTLYHLGLKPIFISGEDNKKNSLQQSVRTICFLVLWTFRDKNLTISFVSQLVGRSEGQSVCYLDGQSIDQSVSWSLDHLMSRLVLSQSNHSW